MNLIEGVSYNNRTWLCKCDCGGKTVAKEKYLRSGHKKSCGCLYGKSAYMHGETKTRLHKIWSSMIERCEYTKHMHYKDYGGRGIIVCDEWHKYIPFRNWALKNDYADNLTLDRENVNGNYEPSNCRWITMKEQHNNKRNNHNISVNGVVHTISEWSEITGIGKTTIRERLRLGWTNEDALTTQVRLRTKGYRPSFDAKMDNINNDTKL